MDYPIIRTFLEINPKNGKGIPLSSPYKINYNSSKTVDLYQIFYDINWVDTGFINKNPNKNTI